MPSYAACQADDSYGAIKDPGVISVLLSSRPISYFSFKLNLLSALTRYSRGNGFPFAITSRQSPFMAALS
jgi:hypothetical protein